MYLVDSPAVEQNALLIRALRSLTLQAGTRYMWSRLPSLKPGHSSPDLQKLVLLSRWFSDITPFHFQDNADIQISISTQRPNLEETTSHVNVEREGGGHCNNRGSLEIFLNVWRYGNWHLKKKKKTQSKKVKIHPFHSCLRTWLKIKQITMRLFLCIFSLGAETPPLPAADSWAENWTLCGSQIRYLLKTHPQKGKKWRKAD